MQLTLHRLLLLGVGVTLAMIGVVYCLDPNLLLARYDISVSGVSEDNMYRGAYGGLFITLGAAISFGCFAADFRQNATLLALLFMGGFALGRIASIAMLGVPHAQIVSLLMFEVVTAAAFAWFLLAHRRQLHGV